MINSLLVKLLGNIYNEVDQLKDQKLSFGEFAIIVSIAYRGTFEEKAQLAFKLYDSNSVGLVTRDDLYNTMKILQSLGILKLSLDDISPNKTYTDNEIEQVLDQLFENPADADCLDFAAFASQVHKYPIFIEGLGIYHFFFYPMIKPIVSFLSGGDPYEKEGSLAYKNTVYYYEIKGGLLNRYDKNVC
jgi:Ca2+-binding EF-hand superfamily protein